MKSLIGSLALCTLLALSSASFGADAKKDEKTAAAPINKKCPVEGGDVDSEVTVQHDGKTIGFCCAGCDAEFKKDPAKFMAIVDKEIAKDAPKKDAPAKKGDKKKEVKLNTKCPVSGDDADKSITSDYKGKKVAFCCEDCQKDFEKDPAKYAAKLEEKKPAKKDDHADHDHKEGEEQKDHAEEKPAK
jgi:YHS domain-containing protein